jgi:hypothetical protein
MKHRFFRLECGNGSSDYSEENNLHERFLNPPNPLFQRGNNPLIPFNKDGSISPFSKGGKGDLRRMQDSFPHFTLKNHKNCIPLSLLYRIFFIIFSFTFFITVQSEAAFKDNFLGAKSMAMGGAYTAIADDVDGTLINPAVLSMIKAQQIVATMAVLYPGLSDDSLITQNVVGYAHKSDNIGSLGVVWKRFGVGNLYNENILALSYARSSSLYLTKGEQNRPKNFSLGGSLKLMNWDSAPTVDAGGKVIEDLPGWTGISFDAGFVIWPSPNTPVAVSFQNLRKPDISSSQSKIKEKLPFATRMGVAAIDKNTTWAMDLILKGGQIDLKIGLEKRTLDGKLFLRTGIALENLAWGMNFTVGAGYKLNNSTRIDYAYVYPINTILNTMGSHRISIVYNFGEEENSNQ